VRQKTHLPRKEFTAARLCQRAICREAENRQFQKGDLAATLRVISITFLVGPLYTDTLRGTMQAFLYGSIPKTWKAAPQGGVFLDAR
jgi:hypothetical protein